MATYARLVLLAVSIGVMVEGCRTQRPMTTAATGPSTQPIRASNPSQELKFSRPVQNGDLVFQLAFARSEEDFYLVVKVRNVGDSPVAMPNQPFFTLQFVTPSQVDDAPLPLYGNSHTFYLGAENFYWLQPQEAKEVWFSISNADKEAVSIMHVRLTYSEMEAPKGSFAGTIEANEQLPCQNVERKSKSQKP